MKHVFVLFHFALFWCGRNLVSRSSRAFSPLFPPWAVLPVGWPLLQTWFGRLDHLFRCFKHPWRKDLVPLFDWQLFPPSIMKLRCSILILLAATTAATLAAVTGKHLPDLFRNPFLLESDKWFKHKVDGERGKMKDDWIMSSSHSLRNADETNYVATSESFIRIRIVLILSIFFLTSRSILRKWKLSLNVSWPETDLDRIDPEAKREKYKKEASLLSCISYFEFSFWGFPSTKPRGCLNDF